MLLNFFTLSLSGGSSSSLSGILGSASEMLTWFIASMGSLLTFIFANPVILCMFLIVMCGSVVGMLMRIWHSA